MLGRSKPFVINSTPLEDQSTTLIKSIGSSVALARISQAFPPAQMAQTPLPYFPDLFSKAESFKLFHKSLDNHGPPTAAFTTTNHGQPRSAFINQSHHQSGRHSYSHHGNGRSNSRQGRRPPRCQICRQEGHYTDK